MTRVDFYLLAGNDETARQLFTCRLAEKARQLNNRLLIQTNDSEAGRSMDAALWNFKIDSFLPHATSPASQQIPIHIGWSDNNTPHHDLLINLSDNIPKFFSQFSRVAEIVSQDEQQLAISRQRYRFYQERGYEIKINDMKKST
ncbi:MAG: DNA polymerase III subunit chi [Pseudomonadales bacterium]